MKDASILACSALIGFVVLVFWEEIIEGAVLRLRDFLTFMMLRLWWCVELSAKLRARLKELQDRDRNL